ncbi:hypothetical protein NT239_02010 [Chitinibacter sp. SCUT-21]|uniref:lipopolysaccharide biosynthesis protein n=1 Tax=Chitinibacter sp. SCUT-21 TaxID=2970891 RepID=UPI0035A612C6
MATSFHRAAFESIGAKALYLFTRLAIPPMVLAKIGLAEYGLWSIAFVLVGYLGLSVSGLATVYVREIAQAYERNDAEHASGMLSTGVAMALLIGSLFCLGLACSLPVLLNTFKVSPHLQALASTLIIATTLVFLADLTLGAWGYVLHALHRVHEQQRIWVASFMLEWLLIAVLLQLDFGMQALLVAFIVRYSFSIACAWWRVQQIWPLLHLAPQFVARRYLAPFLNLGLKSQLSDGCAMILHSADRLLAAISFGSASAAILDLGSKLPATATSIVSGISAVALPRSACMNAEQLRIFYPKVLRLATFALLPIMPLLVACAPAINLAWLGHHTQAHIILQAMLWLTPAWHCHILTGSASSALRGQGRIKLEFVYHALRGVSLGLAYWLSESLLQFISFFALGAASSALIYLVIASRALQMRAQQLARTCLLPVSVCYGTAYSLYWLWPWQLQQRSDAVLALCQAGLVLTALLAVLCWTLILTDSEKHWLGEQYSRFFKREVHHA